MLRTDEKAQRVPFYPFVFFLCSPTVASPFNQRSSSLIAVVLLDTTQEEKLEWTKYPFGAEANTPGVSFAINATQSRSAGVVEGPPLRGFHQRRWSAATVYARSSIGTKVVYASVTGSRGAGVSSLACEGERACASKGKKMKKYEICSTLSRSGRNSDRVRVASVGTKWARWRKNSGFRGYQKHFIVSVRAAYVGSRWPVRSLGAMFVFQLLSAQRAARQV